MPIVAICYSKCCVFKSKNEKMLVNTHAMAVQLIAIMVFFFLFFGFTIVFCAVRFTNTCT